MKVTIDIQDAQVIYNYLLSSNLNMSLIQASELLQVAERFKKAIENPKDNCQEDIEKALADMKGK